jgi:hypothetical protein
MVYSYCGMSSRRQPFSSCRVTAAGAFDFGRHDDGPQVTRERFTSAGGVGVEHREPARETVCAKYAYPVDPGDGSNGTGKALNCRMYHLEKAYEPDASPSECANTAESGPNLQFPGECGAK